MGSTVPHRSPLAVLAALPIVFSATFISSPLAVAAERIEHQPTPVAAIEPTVTERIAQDGLTTFWLLLREQADLSAAAATKDHDLRGKLVVDQLESTAARSQAAILALLRARNVSHQSFWVANTIKVTGDAALLAELSTRPEVAQVVADKTYQIPDPIPGQAEAVINAVEWGIDRVGAPKVWSTFGVRGEEIVVANIDTGAQFNHPALVRQYRGRKPDGTFDHNYNWHDPSKVCGNPSLVPCDNNGHGTHTMGTMVGDDGDPGPNQIGVAPKAKWIAAKGCESFGCSLSALLSSGQFVLAPTDLNGQNPRPAMRPHVVNNSWGGGGSDPFYQATVRAWVASGVFPAFANGNSGPGCGSVSAPGSYPESYGVGAFDINNNIAPFSSRGPSPFGSIIKPNIAAPGVNVRSSVPGNQYASFSGTSMATPHLAGGVALMWSAAPAIERDITATRNLLDQTATRVSDLACGGTADNNNVWGRGRLSAFDAVDQAPRGPNGPLSGKVTNASNGSALAGADIKAVGPFTRTTSTDAAGNYSFRLPFGTYDVTARLFGFLSKTDPVTIDSASGTTLDFALTPAPRHAVSGAVRDSDGPIQGATVTILNTPLNPATTDANGAYSFPSVPEETYDARAEATRCHASQTRQLVVGTSDVVNFDFTLASRSDKYAHFCRPVPFSFIDGTTVLPLSGFAQSAQVALPFAFTYFDRTYDVAHVTTSGFLNFLGPNVTPNNLGIPDPNAPNAAIFPFWSNIFVDGQASVRSASVGTAPNRQFAIEWRNVAVWSFNTRVTFEAVLHENGRILFSYKGINPGDPIARGSRATIGIQNHDGKDGLQYSFNEQSVRDQFSILFQLPPSGFVTGTVTDANDGEGVAGVTIRLSQSGEVKREALTNAKGFYRSQPLLGAYDVEFSKTNYSTETGFVSVDAADASYPLDAILATPRAEVAPGSFELTAVSDTIRSRTLTIRNTGSLPMNWEIKEAGGRAVTTSSTIGLKQNPNYDPNSRTTEGLFEGGTPPGWSPMAPGNVIRSWTPTGLSLAWGVGYTGNVWLSDVPFAKRNHEFSVTGTPTGRAWGTPWAGAWGGDMAYDAGRNLLCQVNVGGDNGIYCLNPANGDVVNTITGNFPWTSTSQRGLAYKAQDDTFFIGGWNQQILYQVKGLSYPDKGAIVNQCRPADGLISGLAYNPAFDVVWAATNSPTDTIYQLNPKTCQVLSTIAHPGPRFNGAGLEMDEEGNLWMIRQNPNTVFLVESGVPAFVKVPWLDETPASGTLAPGQSQEVTVTIDTSQLQPGVYSAFLFVLSNSGRQQTHRVPLTLVVPAYQQGANAGGPAYVDVLADNWSPDQVFTPGSWGFVDPSETRSTTAAISGTTDPALYQDARVGHVEYRFESLPTGTYQVELRFAEIEGRERNERLFDVVINDVLVLAALDIAARAGQDAAFDQSFFMKVTGGTVSVRFIPRLGFDQPIINALRVTHRPDR